MKTPIDLDTGLMIGELEPSDRTAISKVAKLCERTIAARDINGQVTDAPLSDTPTNKDMMDARTTLCRMLGASSLTGLAAKPDAAREEDGDGE